MQMNPQFGDKEMLTDALHAQKLCADVYNLNAIECANEPLKNELLHLLNEEHAIQYDVYTQMHQRGWYPVKAADQQAIDEVKQKYPQ